MLVHVIVRHNMGTLVITDTDSASFDSSCPQRSSSSAVTLSYCHRCKVNSLELKSELTEKQSR